MERPAENASPLNAERARRPALSNPLLGLKIDVDTYRGMKEGVPRLLAILARFGVKATFYLSVGPDASGRALLQLLRNPRFLKKMVRTNAPGLYGFRSALYGTFLPSPMIALSFPDLVERILKEGHEAAFHAWDHRRWQDELSVRSMDWIRDWFDRGVTAFERLTGRRPASFGAPAWLIDDRALEVAAGHRFDYVSCTRAAEPFVHAGWGLVEIPSDLPCFEETGPEPGVPKILDLLKEGGLHVLPVHAEAEGGIWSRYFIDLLEKTASTGCTILPLGEIRKSLPIEALPVRKHRMALLPGRSTPCAV